MTTVLLTGFEPFRGARINPSWEAARTVAQTWDGNGSVVAHLLPVEFRRSSQELAQALETHRPDVVISLGLAEGRDAVTPERIAINVDDAPIPDNAGAQPRDTAVVKDGPAAYFSTLPVKAIVSALDVRGIPAALSHSAGTYLCNHLFYELQHRTRDLPVRSGFVHVPATPQMGLPEQVPTLTAALIADGVRTAIVATLAAPSDDPHAVGGTIH